MTALCARVQSSSKLEVERKGLKVYCKDYYCIVLTGLIIRCVYCSKIIFSLSTSALKGRGKKCMYVCL